MSNGTSDGEDSSDEEESTSEEEGCDHPTDENGDHACDVCGEQVNVWCRDDDRNHYCDDCLYLIVDSYCLDENKDHKCDFEGCLFDMTFGEHTDSDGDHVCEYGCQEPVSECFDENEDGLCDQCGETIPEETSSEEETSTEEETSSDEEPLPDDDDDDGDDEDEETTEAPANCQSSLGSIGFITITALGAAFVSKKKKK